MAEVNLDVAMESTSQEILEKVANGVEPSFRSPIAMQHSYVSSAGTVLNVTGKGVAGIISGYYTNQFTVIVDGITMFTKGTLGDGEYQSLVFEFTESVKITLDYVGASNAKGAWCVLY